MIGEAAGKDLGLGLQPAESAGVNDAVAVALEIVAIGMLGLGNAASAGLLHPHGVVGQHRESLALGSDQHLARAVGSGILSTSLRTSLALHRVGEDARP